MVVSPCCAGNGGVGNGVGNGNGMTGRVGRGGR